VGWSRESGDRKGGGRLRVQDADGASQSAISHIDQTLALIGYVDGTPVFGRTRRFANGELIALIGEAERSGHKTVNAIVQYVMGAKSLDPTDEKLRRKIVFSVKDCRKRMAARGV
jgi:hypothetical protein